MAISKSGLTAPGKDQICYTMLGPYVRYSVRGNFTLYNKIWQEGKLPEIWKKAVIVPIRKTGKGSTNPYNDRPIELTSHMCKIMERMITERLTYYLETRNLRSNIKVDLEKVGEQWIL